MSDLSVQDLIAQDRVGQMVTAAVNVRSHKHMPTGWIKINCPMCVAEGETRADRRLRGGILLIGNNVRVKCLNCNYRAGFSIGYHLRHRMREFLVALGIPQREIALAAYWAEQLCRLVTNDATLRETLGVAPTHPSITLPPGARSLDDWLRQGCDDRYFEAVIDYLYSRGDVAVQATTYYWTPDTRYGLHRRLIIPCYQDRRLVGWTARSVDGATPRYHKEIPPNYLFNMQYLAGSRLYVFIVEGVFDALVIDGVAALGATLTEQEIALINQSDKQPVVVPDRDRAGGRLVDIAIEQQWAVAAPLYGRHQWWEPDIKDVAEAVRRYGKLYVMQSILATQSTHPGQIQQRASYLMR